MPVTDDEGLREILELHTVAVVGCSSTPGKDAHSVPKYLQRHGYEVIPVNPFADEILGQKAYDSLAVVEAEIDIVEVFRPSEEVPGIVDEVLERHASRGDVKALWLQRGIRDEDAAARAEAVGIKVVQDKCMRAKYRRLMD